MIRWRHVVAISGFLVGACSASGPHRDGGVDFGDGGFDGSPGQLGWGCIHLDVDAGTGCAVGFHCSVGAIGEMAQDVCVPDSQATLGEGQPCLQREPVGTLPGERVVSADRCNPGLACAGVQGTVECRKLCRRRSQCALDEVCGVATDSPTRVATCAVPDVCNPVAHDGCGGGLACYLAGDDRGRFTICQLTNDPPHQVEGDCRAQRDCAPGLMCVARGFCRTLCLVAPPPGATVGLCGPNEPPCSRLAGAPDNLGVCDAP